jgi:hypothetical protein
VTDKFIPEIVFSRSLPPMRCPRCGEFVEVGVNERKSGKIPPHVMLGEQRLKCPASGGPLKDEYFIDR